MSRCTKNITLTSIVALMAVGVSCTTTSLPTAEFPRVLSSRVEFESPAANRRVERPYAQSMASMMRSYLRHGWKISRMDLDNGMLRARLCQTHVINQRGKEPQEKTTCSSTIATIDRSNGDVTLWVSPHHGHNDNRLLRYLNHLETSHKKNMVKPYHVIEQQLGELGFDISPLNASGPSVDAAVVSR